MDIGTTENLENLGQQLISEKDYSLSKAFQGD